MTSASYRVDRDPKGTRWHSPVLVLLCCSLVAILYHFHHRAYFISDTFRLFAQLETHGLRDFLFLHWEAHFMPVFRLLFALEALAFGDSPWGYFLVSYLLQGLFGMAFYFWLLRLDVSCQQAGACALLLIGSINGAGNTYWHIAQSLQLYGVLSFASFWAIERHRDLGRRRDLLLAMLLASINTLSCAEGILGPLLTAMYLVVVRMRDDSIRKPLLEALACLLCYLPYVVLARGIFPPSEPLIFQFDILQKLRYIVVASMNGLFYQMPFARYCVPEAICYVLAALVLLFIIRLQSVLPSDRDRGLVRFCALAALGTYALVALGRQAGGVYHGIKQHYHYLAHALALVVILLAIRNATSPARLLHGRVLSFVLCLALLGNFVGIRVVQAGYWVESSDEAKTDMQRLCAIVSAVDPAVPPLVPDIALGPHLGKTRVSELWPRFLSPAAAFVPRFAGPREVEAARREGQPVLEALIDFERTQTRPSSQPVFP